MNHMAFNLGCNNQKFINIKLGLVSHALENFLQIEPQLVRI